jgi:mono/diheme cytochrome c family protein
LKQPGTFDTSLVPPPRPALSKNLSRMMHGKSLYRWLWLLVACLLVPAAARAESPIDGAARIQYDRDIRPLLSDRCFKCHGPDAQQRQAGLRLDEVEAAFKPLESEQTPIVPGKPETSELVRRIFAEDADERMPPPDSGKELSPAERDLLRAWVAQGAEHRRHWSFVRPQRLALPPVKDLAWTRNPIDRFILARLEAERLRPAGEADKEALIRRVTLDLTGLPPTLEEIDAFLADASPDAYEKLVDRLLQSPRFGERMALEWLDAARYADTHGYHIDSHRDMWKWREWVIEAFNRNLPFDRFTVEQLAGDLLPGATLQQRIASGFNRNHMINFEGGAIPEEYLTAYIVDRVNTTATVWLGLTVACSQCHDHKYDPLSQKEFYRLYAFFNNVPEQGLDGKKGNAAPLLRIPTRQQQQKSDELAAAMANIEERIKLPHEEVDAAQAEWELAATVEQPVEWTTLEAIDFTSLGGATLTRLDDLSLLASGENPAQETYRLTLPVRSPRLTALRLEVLPDESFNAKGPGRSASGNFVLTDVRVVAGSDAVQSSKPRKFKEATTEYSQKNYTIAAAIDGKPDTGWAIFPQVGKPHTAVFELEQPIAAEEQATLILELDFQSEFKQHQFGRFRLFGTDSKDPHGKQSLPEKVREILALEPSQREEQQSTELRAHYRGKVSPIVKRWKEEIASLKKSQEELDKQIPSSMVMQELDKARDTFLLMRGQYDKPGEKVSAGVPAALGYLPEDAPANRLGLAQWLVQSDHPLTARVIVNRYWQMYFGTGLVKTSEDFGSQGEWPSHPELLDWLATEFIASGWDVKAMQRLIVTSATYRQSSAVTPSLAARDPENRLLARGPRFRLPAELIRDQALAVSGLLNVQIGGQSVSPYQPAGLWEEMAFGKEFTAQTYVQSHGADLYRRGMYTFWKRTVPPATMSTFDAPDRETCTVRRLRTNTPLQALVLMNDPTYLEAARKLAERVLLEAGSSPSERIAYAFRLATARRPSERELAVLERIYQEQLRTYQQNPEAAAKLLSVGESPRNGQLDPIELAAWSMVASVILNLDEAVTKG